MDNKHKHQHQRLLTAEEFEVRIWGFVVIVVTVVLAGIVGFMLYSLAFVTQPIKTMAPMDQAFAKMLNDIVLLIVGGIGGVMSRKGVQDLSQKLAANDTPPPQPAAVTPPQQVAAAPSASPAPAASSGLFGFDFIGGYKNPDLDESWVAPPPPSTPPDHIDPARDEIAHERAAARAES